MGKWHKTKPPHMLEENITKRDVAVMSFFNWCNEREQYIRHLSVEQSANSHNYSAEEVRTLYRTDRLGLSLNKADKRDDRIAVERRGMAIPVEHTNLVRFVKGRR